MRLSPEEEYPGQLQDFRKKIEAHAKGKAKEALISGYKAGITDPLGVLLWQFNPLDNIPEPFDIKYV